MSQFIDQVDIEVVSGDGGNGHIGWRKEKYEPLGGPAGGNGGRGGSVFIEATSDLSTLIDFRFKAKFVAENGIKGGNKNRHGRAGQDIVIRVPVGTTVKDKETNRVIADLTKAGEKVMVAQGGYGGVGNTELATPTTRAPHFCEPGEPGITRKLELTLKLLADVGIIGLPNAGKSTLLAAVTRAKPKIADYPFSTLEPNLGVVKLDPGQQKSGLDGFVLADIPGLIEGASNGVGLGHKFLRHVERTRLLIHMVDITSENVLADMETINRELALYDQHLSSLPQMVALNKCEMMLEEEAEEIKATLEKHLKGEVPVYLISAYARQGTSELIAAAGRMVEEARQAEKQIEREALPVDEAAKDHGKRTYTIEQRNGVYYVLGDRATRLVNVTDLKDPESLFHLFQRLRVMGVIEELIAEGVEPGSEVSIGGVIFTYGEGMG
ncbi:MAG: GTPase ObgE [Cyanobacteria bacterium SZAS LIN-2]|nr:GTPase ObgE [Cyanobacteria bacterium SZAS LIN-3]MBS1998265.1 GTPase ObgE [Cyanobacteria bacterium SZAS LIN-2]